MTSAPRLIPPRARRVSAFVFAVLVALGACAPATMRLDPSLETRSAPMTVEGRNGWWFGQTLRFGPYRTDAVRRGWTFGWEIPFVVRFRGAEERLAFRQYAPVEGRTEAVADVFLVNARRDEELRVAGELFSVVVTDRTTLAGSIVTPGGVWELLAATAGDDLRGSRSDGFLRSADVAFELREVHDYAASTGAFAAGEPIGWEFLDGGRIVGAVELLGGGRVWLAPELRGDARLALAATASSLLLRAELDVDP